MLHEKGNASKAIPSSSGDASSTPENRLARRAPAEKNANRHDRRTQAHLKDERQGFNEDVGVFCI